MRKVTAEELAILEKPDLSICKIGPDGKIQRETEDPFNLTAPKMDQGYVTPQGTVLATKAQEQAQNQAQSELDIPAFLRRQIS